MLEAFMATILTPQRGEEFVGMQGDMWDSQEDMFMAALGTVVAVLIIAALVAPANARRAGAAHVTSAGRGKIEAHAMPATVVLLRARRPSFANS